MIFWLIILLFVVGWVLITPTTFLWRKFNELDKFIYTLLYRGYAEEGVGVNAELGIGGACYDVAIVKYKEKGEIGLYLIVGIEKIDVEKKILENEVKKRNLEYYVRTLKETSYVVDMKRDIKMVKSMLKFIWEKICKEKELLFYMNFTDISKNPNKIIDFKDAKELEEKGIDIKIPIVKWQWVLWKIKHPGKRV